MDPDLIVLENSLLETAVFPESIMVLGKLVTNSLNCMHRQFTFFFTYDATLVFKFKKLFYTVAR